MATKGNINLQLNINTQFTNVKSAVDAFQKQLSNIKIDANFNNSKGLADNFSKQADQIKAKLQELNNFDFNSRSSKDYANLLSDIKTQYAQLSAAVNDYKVSLGKEKSEVQDKLKTEQENLQALKEKSKAEKEYIDGFQAYHKALAEAKTQNRELTEDEKQLVATYSSETRTMKQLKEDHKNTNQAKRESQAEIKKLQAADKSYTALLKTEKEVQSQVKTAIKTTTAARQDEYTAAKNQEAANKSNAAQLQKQAEAQNKQAETIRKAAEEEKKTQQIWQQASSTFVDDFQKAASGSDELTTALDRQITKWTSLGFIVATAKRAISDIVQTYQELDDNLSAISAVSSIATDQLWGDMPQMIDNANNLALSIDDLTNGMLLFYQQGLSTEETEIRLNAAGKMAAISQQDLATAVDQLTSTMNAFGMEGDDATNVVDVFANMAGKTATDVEELATAMARTASIAKNAGMSFEQTTAFIATMEETTRLSAETIGNSMKSIIARFQKLKTDPTSLLEDGVNANDVEKALKKANVALRDTEGNFRNIGDVIMELSAKWDTLDTNTQKYIATMAAGTQQSSNFIALVSNYQSNVDNLAYAMDSAGAAEEQFAAISTNISSALTRLDNNWTKLKTSFGDGRNIIVSVIDAFSNLLSFVSKIGANFTLLAAGTVLLTAKLLLLGIQQTKRAATEAMLLTLDKSSISNAKKKLAANILLEASSKGLNANYVQERLSLLGLSEAEATEISTKYGQATANGVATLSWISLKEAINGATTAVKGFLLSNPIGWIVIAVSSIAILKTGLDKLGVTLKGAKEKADAAKESFKEITSEIESAQSELDSINSKIDELNSKENPTLMDQAELQKLDLAAIKQQKIIDKLKETQIEAAKTQLTADQSVYDKSTSGLWYLDTAEKNPEAAKNASDDSPAAQSKKELDKAIEAAQAVIDDYDTLISLGETLSSEQQKNYDEQQNLIDRYDKIFNTESYIKKTLVGELSPEELAQAKEKGELIGDAIRNGLMSKAQQSKEFYNYFLDYLDSNQDVLTSLGGSEEGISELQDAYKEATSYAEAYGNVLIGQRQEIIWNEQAIEDYGDAMRSLGNDIPNIGDTSTILGASSAYSTNGAEGFGKEIELAFTPVLQVPGGEPVVLTQEQIDNYLQTIVDKASEDGQIDMGEILKLDASGLDMEINGQMTHISGMVAAAEGDIVKTTEGNLKMTAAAVAASAGASREELAESFDKVQEGEDEAVDYFVNHSMHDAEQAWLDFEEKLSETETGQAILELIHLFEEATGIDLSGISNGLNDAADAADNATNAVSSLKTQMSEVSNAASDLKNAASDLSGVADAYKTLTTTIKDYNADGNITLSNLESLLSLSPEYLSCLEMENGQLSLNTEGLKGIVLMRIQAAKAAAYQSAMEQIQAITMSSSATAASTAGEAIAGMEAATSNAATAISTASNTAATSTGTMANLAQSGYTVAAGFDTAASSAANFNNVLANKLTEAGTGVKYTAEDVASMIAGDISGITDVLGDAVGDVVTGLQSQLSMLDNLENQVNSMDFGSFIGKYGGSSKGGSGGSGTKGATEASNELKNALEAQKKALESQKQALQDQKAALEEQKKALDELNNSLKENLKLYFDLIKTRLNKEIDKQTETIKAFYDAIKDSIQSEIDTFEDQLDALNKKADELQKAADNQKDSLSKLYDAAKAYYDAASDGIDNEIAGIDRVIERNNEKVEVLKEQQDAIQAQIDALDDAADSESKLLALEKARDALATARQQKTRLVLTNGGGWRFKTDKSAVQEAQSNLTSAQRDYQKEVLERQVKKLDNQIDGIDKVNDNLDDVKDGLEGQKEILSDISDQWDTINDSLGKTASEIQEQTELIKKFQYGSNDSRYGELTNFAGGVTNNQQQQQEASDASNKYEEQSNADKKGTLAEAIEKLKEQQNQADQAFEEYFTNQLSNNAESQKIQQEMKALIDSIVGTSIGSLESFNQYQEGINSAFDRANESASLNAQYINDINAAISRYEEWSNRLGMTTDEINARQAIENEINNATLGSLIEGGVTFNKLNDQYKEAIKNNDTSADIDRQVKVVENQISDVEQQISDVSNRISEAKEAANKAASDTNKTINSAANRIASAIANQSPTQITITSPHTGNSGSTKVTNKQISAVMNIGGMLGFSRGGVDDVTRTVAVHGTKNRPELILNNSQSAALFKYIDSMTRIPTLSSAGSARNALSSFGTTNNTTNSGTNFTNCKFDIESNADNLDSLVQDLKQSASIRR